MPLDKLLLSQSYKGHLKKKKLWTKSAFYGEEMVCYYVLHQAMLYVPTGELVVSKTPLPTGELVVSKTPLRVLSAGYFRGILIRHN